MLIRRLVVGEGLAGGPPTLSLVPVVLPFRRNEETAIPSFAMPRTEHRREGFSGRQDALNV